MNNKSDKKHSEEFFGEARDYWWNDDYLELLANRLDFDSYKTMIDVGCGQGHMSFKLEKYLGTDARVFGVDLEEEWIKIANQKAEKRSDSERFNFQPGDAYQLPFEDNTADITICQTVLIHLEDPLSAIKEMKRVTKPGGLIVALEPNNLINSLTFDSISAIDDDVEDILSMVEFELRMQKGKRALGEGFSSIGDVVPEYFKKAGLKDTQVWIGDEPMSIIPPYDTPKKKSRANELITWIKSGQVEHDYDQNLKYYLAGGGDKENFNRYWQKLKVRTEELLERLEKEEYITAGGALLYIIAAKV